MNLLMNPQLRRQMVTSSQFWSLTTLALIATSFGLTGCKKVEEAQAAEVSVQAERAESKPLTEYVSADTVLVPQAQAAIVPKISAPIQSFLVQRGDHVHKGQLLAVLENADLAAAVQDTRGAVTQADASYVATTKASVLEDMQKAELDLSQAKANLDLQQSIVDSRRELLQQGAIPRRDLDTAQAALVQAKATYDIANQHLKSLRSVSQSATLKSAEGALDSAKGKYEAAQASLHYSEIRSPLDGVVTDRPLFSGEMANAGQAIVTVMDVSSLLAKVHLSQDQVRAIKLGAKATLSISGAPDPIQGKVSLISPELDPGSTTLEVWVLVPNKGEIYRAGTPVRVSLAARTVSEAVAVPNESIISTKSGSPAVMVVGADSIAHQKTLEIGITDGHDTQVTNGLKAGDLVITTGVYGMDDGTKVKVVAAGAEDDTVGNPSSTASGGKTVVEPSAKKSATGQEEKQP
jgi:multidrug efflux pump subunit AcrA (membrane-fusion protein)